MIGMPGSGTPFKPRFWVLIAFLTVRPASPGCWPRRRQENDWQVERAGAAFDDAASACKGERRSPAIGRTRPYELAEGYAGMSASEDPPSRGAILHGSMTPRRAIGRL